MNQWTYLMQAARDLITLVSAGFTLAITILNRPRRSPRARRRRRPDAGSVTDTTKRRNEKIRVARSDAGDR